MKKYWRYLVTAFGVCILFCVLNTRTGWISYEYSSGYFSNDTYLHGGIGSFQLDKRIIYRVRYEVNLKSGKVTGELYDSTYDIEAFGKAEEQQIVARTEMEKSGTYYMDLPITDSGNYYLAEYAVEGSRASVDTYVEVRQYRWQILLKWIQRRIRRRILNYEEAQTPF